MTHDESQEVLALHALGALEDPERRALEPHLEACAACAATLAELRDTAASLAWVSAPVAPPRGHLARVLAALDGDGSARAAGGRIRRPLARAMRLAVAAGVLLLVGTQVALLRRLHDAYVELAQMRRMGAFVASPNVSIVPMWGPRATEGAHAKLAYDRVTGRFVLLSSHLQPPPKGMRYQLWVIAEGVEPAAAFLPDAPNGVLVAPPHGDEMFLFGVSVEPAGETDEPSGSMVLMSGAVRNVR